MSRVLDSDYPHLQTDDLDVEVVSAELTDGGGSSSAEVKATDREPGDQTCANCNGPLPDYTDFQDNAPPMGPWGVTCPCGATYYTADDEPRWADEPHMIKPERDGYPAHETPRIDESTTTDDPQHEDDTMHGEDTQKLTLDAEPESEPDRIICHEHGVDAKRVRGENKCPACEPGAFLSGDLAGALHHHFDREPHAHYATDLENGRPVYDVRLSAATVRFGVCESEGETFVQFRIIAQNHVDGWRGKGWRLRHDLREVCEAAEDRVYEVMGVGR